MPRLDSLDPQEFVTALATHRASPRVSVLEHVNRKMAGLATLVLRRKRLYLDTCWWIELLNVRLGKSKEPRLAELLARLESLVRSELWICPIGDGIFMELLKQCDVYTRTAMVRLIDDLSIGVTIADSQRRMRLEALHFILGAMTRVTDTGPPVDRVWTKVSQVLGLFYPVLHGLSEEEQCAHAKAFVDVLWARPLSDLLDDSDRHFDREDRTLRAGAERITAASAAHTAEMKSFRQVFLAEIGGVIDLHGAELASAFETIGKAAYGQVNVTPEEREQLKKVARNMFYNIFRLKRTGAALPTIEIPAGLHAVNRWIRNRAFKVEDYYDIAHASSAVPYCTHFLTDKHLATVLTSSLLSFDKKYEAEIMHTVDQALSALR